MPELPEVETVRRSLESSVLGRGIRSVRLSGLPLRDRVPRELPGGLPGHRFTAARRHGKYLLLDLDRGWTLLSHLGMSGRWLFHAGPPARELPHVHARIHFVDRSQLWFQDARRFGQLRLVRTERLAADPSLARLGPDPVAEPITGERLAAMARGARIAVKDFLMDQRRVAGIGNIYASEILHRAGVNPRTPAGRLGSARWGPIAEQTRAVLAEAIARFGTTFRMYRTIWNEPGAYGEQLLVYDRPGEPCRACGTPIRRIVQGARSTFYCPRCQSAGRPRRHPRPRNRPQTPARGRLRAAGGTARE